MKARGNRLLYALLLAALVSCLLPGAALAIGSAGIDGASPVTGTTGSNADAKPFTLTISGNSLNAIPDNAEFTSWMKNMPAGLRVTVESGSPSTKASIHMTIEGTPTQYSSDPFSIVIPKEKLHDSPPVDMTVTPGTNARWDIEPSADSVIAVSLSGGTCYTPYASFAAGWNAAVGSGNTANTKVRLLQNWTAETNGFGTGGGFSNGGILVPAGKTVEMDLCGKTVSANANVTSRAVTVNGTLTLSDSGTGGILTGATHGCVDVAGSGNFTMSGGKISGNSIGNSGEGGGVYSGGNLTVYGQVQITGNTKSSSPNNVFLADNRIINSNTHNGPSIGSIISVTTQTAPVSGSPVQVTTANAKNQIGCFTSDDARYTMQNTPNHVVMLIVAPKKVDIVISPSNQFPVGNAGGNLTVNVGHGIPAADLGVSHISTVKMDSTVLTRGPGADYTITDGGSVIITLHQSYLNTLPAGAHTLSVAIGSGNYGGVTVATSITVAPVTQASHAPKTGDDAQPRLWLCLALAAGAALSAAFVSRRRKRRA